MLVAKLELSWWMGEGAVTGKTLEAGVALLSWVLSFVVVQVGRRLLIHDGVS